MQLMHNLDPNGEHFVTSMNNSSRIPANLVYLTIYNPSLKIVGTQTENDEDAEEQAHIVFYTSKERAVSRDRMLRQVGLAKALVSFAEMFNVDKSLDNVHSQSRRMIMISPEPGFWIHACVELAKRLKTIQDKGNKGNNKKDKGKVKGKSGSSKGKESNTNDSQQSRGQGQLYDYEEGSIHDEALRRDIMIGYERFKLTHGSFTWILETLGQEALGLQLERFWTPWAWSWSLESESGHDFGEQLGIALHPYFKPLLPLLDSLQTTTEASIAITITDDNTTNSPTINETETETAKELIPILLSPTNIIPSTLYLSKDFPISIPIYLKSLIPSPPDTSSLSINEEEDKLASSQITLKGKEDKEKDMDKDKNSEDNGKGKGKENNNGFLNMNMNVNMDMRKWKWSGVWNSIAPGSSSKTSSVVGSSSSSPRSSVDHKSVEGIKVEEEKNKDEDKDKDEDKGEDKSRNKKDEDEERGANEDGDVKSIIEGVVDQNALEDAISSEVSSLHSFDAVHQREEIIEAVEDVDSKSEQEQEQEQEELEQEESIVTPKPVPHFMRKTIYLQDDNIVDSNSLVTSQRKVYFLLKDQWMLALIGGKPECEGTELQDRLDNIANQSDKFWEDVEDIIRAEMIKSTTDSLPSASKILQPSDRYIISNGKYTFSKKFETKSGLLYEAKALQERDSEISEVYSRGQNPQHWHIARRSRSYIPSPSPSPSPSVPSSGNGDGGGTTAPTTTTTREPAEVYLEVFKKEASLADVDNVVAGLVRSWKGIVDDVEGL